ncbi:hypothetical protein HED60_08820 [Planctomycetales bacterium ZRK34]|nr:hypothetical protein HED60_08820 [Planctomycetales bacterium ZRK34]
MPLTHAPIETVEPVDCQAPPSDHLVSCGKCDKTYRQGGVVSEYAGMHSYEECYFAVRRLYCDHCHHIQVWQERIDPVVLEDVLVARAKGHAVDISDFRFTGIVLSGPGYTTGRRAIEAFLTKHPEAAGVSQS